MDRIIRAIIDAKYDTCVDRAVRRMQRIPSENIHGDDSPLRTLWDLWKWELQQEHSIIIHGAIRDMVEQAVRDVVNQLSPEDGALMTLVTDEYTDIEIDDEPTGPVFLPDAVLREVMSRVNGRASDEPHRREVQRVIDERDRDRHERDMAAYR